MEGTARLKPHWRNGNTCLDISSMVRPGTPQQTPGNSTAWASQCDNPNWDPPNRHTNPYRQSDACCTSVLSVPDSIWSGAGQGYPLDDRRGEVSPDIFWRIIGTWPMQISSYLSTRQSICLDMCNSTYYIYIYISIYIYICICQRKLGSNLPSYGWFLFKWLYIT